MSTVIPGLIKPKKSVDFHNSLKVVLIPSRCEYKAAGLCDKLWWNSSEFQYFQRQSYSEIMFMAKDENLDVRSARRKLYQPSFDEAQFNFILDSCEMQMGSLRNNSHQQLGAQSPRKLVKSPIGENYDSESESDDTTNEHQPLQQKSSLFAVSSLQNISKMVELHSIDQLSTLEADALSLCVPLDDVYDVEFERNLKGVSYLQRFALWCPSTLTLSIAVITVFMFLMTILLSKQI